MKIYPYLQIDLVLRATILREDYVLEQWMPPIKREGCDPEIVLKKR